MNGHSECIWTTLADELSLLLLVASHGLSSHFCCRCESSEEQMMFFFLLSALWNEKARIGNAKSFLCLLVFHQGVNICLSYRKSSSYSVRDYLADFLGSYRERFA